MLRPASPGTGIIAGKTVRAVVESAGVKDILSKSLGSNNPSNVVKATLAGLLQLRLREDIYRDRGIEIKKRPVAVPVAVPVAAAAPAVAARAVEKLPPQSAIRNPQSAIPRLPLWRRFRLLRPPPVAPPPATN